MYGRDCDTTAPPPDHYCADSVSKITRWQRLYPGYFGLTFVPWEEVDMGGSGYVSSIFIYSLGAAVTMDCTRDPNTHRQKKIQKQLLNHSCGIIHSSTVGGCSISMYIRAYTHTYTHTCTHVSTLVINIKRYPCT